MRQLQAFKTLFTSLFIQIVHRLGYHYWTKKLYFSRYILDFLRDGTILLPYCFREKERLKNEAEKLLLQGLVEAITSENRVKPPGKNSKLKKSSLSCPHCRSDNCGLPRKFPVWKGRPSRGKVPETITNFDQWQGGTLPGSFRGNFERESGS